MNFLCLKFIQRNSTQKRKNTYNNKTPYFVQTNTWIIFEWVLQTWTHENRQCNGQTEESVCFFFFIKRLSMARDLRSHMFRIFDFINEWILMAHGKKQKNGLDGFGFFFVHLTFCSIDDLVFCLFLSSFYRQSIIDLSIIYTLLISVACIKFIKCMQINQWNSNKIASDAFYFLLF